MALTDTRIVALVGPRQSGKTTLARRFADDEQRPFITLDDDQFRRFAQEDPVGFMRGRRAAVIDEIQRAPALILELKKLVDEDPTPGRYLITGSVELFKSAISPDSLAGRVETIELLPFSQAEAAVAGVPDFLTRAFAGDFPNIANTGTTDNLVERVLSGGYPEVLAHAKYRLDSTVGCERTHGRSPNETSRTSRRSASSTGWLPCWTTRPCPQVNC